MLPLFLALLSNTMLVLGIGPPVETTSAASDVGSVSLSTKTALAPGTLRWKNQPTNPPLPLTLTSAITVWEETDSAGGVRWDTANYAPTLTLTGAAPTIDWFEVTVVTTTRTFTKDVITEMTKTITTIFSGIVVVPTQTLMRFPLRYVPTTGSHVP
ncbi:hypothetical protein BDV06DRAFT_197800 [Aspergillus oleicola]